MNANKSHEYFSLYFEGELEGGLKEQFERTLRQDAQVQAEYRAFVQTMKELEALKEPVPEPDFDLHEAISRRLDRHFFEFDRRPSASFWTMWRKVAAAGVAALALVGAAASIWNANQGTLGAGVVVGGNQSSRKARPAIDATRLDLRKENGAWTLTYRADAAQTVRISSPDGSNAQTAELDRNGLLSVPLANVGERAMVVEMAVADVHSPVYVALPGSAMAPAEAQGQGDLREFVRAICEKLNRPVVVVGAAGSKSGTWNLGSAETAADLAADARRFGFTAEERATDVVWLL